MSNETAKQIAERTTITISKEAKKVLDDFGKKNENYSSLILRMAEKCGCRIPETEKDENEGNA